MRPNTKVALQTIQCGRPRSNENLFYTKLTIGRIRIPSELKIILLNAKSYKILTPSIHVRNFLFLFPDLFNLMALLSYFRFHFNSVLVFFCVSGSSSRINIHLLLLLHQVYGCIEYLSILYLHYF